MNPDQSFGRIPTRRRARARRVTSWCSRLGGLAVAAALMAGCSSTPASNSVHPLSGSPEVSTSTSMTAAPVAAHGVEAALADVPWARVGPGWTLAAWSPAIAHMPGESPAPNEPTSDTATTTLYLVDPAGNRYVITTFPPDHRGELGLLDWSGDGSHALFGARYPAPSTVISVDLHTGAQTTIPVNGYPRYSRPDGNSILVSTDSDDKVPGTLHRRDLAGNEQFTYPTEQPRGGGQFSGNYLQSPDGAQLVLGTTVDRLVVIGNDGKHIRDLSSPVSKARCSPVRWWTPAVILVHCTGEQSSAGQLWEVPLDGGAATALTAANSGQEDDPGFGGDIGDGVAWQLPSGTFLQSAGACGSMFLSRLTPDMHTTRVSVPGMSDSVVVAGVAADKLVLLGKVGCGGTTSLVTYDPAANTSTVLLGPPVNGGGVTDALPYPDKT
jgi:hypothetical protein